MTLQERIDEMDPAYGGTIYVEHRENLPEPLRIIEKNHITIVGRSVRTNLVARFSEPGPVVFISGCTDVRLSNLGIQTGNEHAECGVLLTREKYNGRGSQNCLDRVYVAGEFAFGCVVSVANELFRIQDCRLEPTRENTYGWWTGSAIPSYPWMTEAERSRGRMKILSTPGPASGGVNTIVRVQGGYVTSTAKGVVSVCIGQGTADAVLDQVCISNSPMWHAQEPPVGEACIRLGNADGVSLRSLRCESPDCMYGLDVTGTVQHLSMTDHCRINGREAIHVERPLGRICNYNSVIDKTCSFTSFGRHQPAIRPEDVMQLDIGSQ